MIIKLHKYLIYGHQVELDAFFLKAQEAGFLEFVGESHKKSLELPDAARKYLQAIKIAKHHFIEPEKVPDLKTEEIRDTLIEYHAELEKCFEEKRLKQLEEVRVAPFGDFAREDISWIENQAQKFIQFYCIKSSLTAEMELSEELLFVGKEYDLDYFMAVHREKKQYPKMAEVHIETPLGELKKELEVIEKQIHFFQTQLRLFSNGLKQLTQALNLCLNDYHLKLVKHDASSHLDQLFVIEAWVPENRQEDLKILIEDFSVEVEPVAIEEMDRIPTCMENEGAARLGEDLVHIYDTPAPEDKDPSLWVLIFFSIFFAIIISDAGYGFLYFLASLFLKWKGPKKNAALQRFSKMGMIVSGCAVLWGIATASFFGLEVGPDSPIRKASFLHYLATKKAEYHIQEKDEVYRETLHEFPSVRGAENGHDFFLKSAKDVDGLMVYPVQKKFYDNVLMEIALLVGCIHLTLSLLRSWKTQSASLGWVLSIVGGYLFFPIYLDATSLTHYLGWFSKPEARDIGLYLLATGPIWVVLVSLLQRKKWGALHELTNGIQIFSDVLSYLRLYALALAGMVMAETFNEMGVKAGMIGGFVIILAGHLVNIVLALMSGVIHGLRLNFLEWYRYSFEGGGRLFNPLRKLK